MEKLAIIVVAVLALAAGIFVSVNQQPLQPPQVTVPASSDLLGSMRPDFRLGNSDGEFVDVEEFAGKTMLINFWATWCVPCREEMPMLMELQTEYGSDGLQVVGIALDDVQSVRDFTHKLGISYTVLVGQADVMDTSRAYGNLSGMLPYSVLVDRQGIIRWQFHGEIQRKDITRRLADIL